jgi:hypothetical protein
MKKDRLKRAYDCLRSKGAIHTQKDLAESMGYAQETVSRAFKGDEKYLTDNFLLHLNKSFGSIFNDDWLVAGKDEMLVRFYEHSNIEQTDDMYMEGYATKDDSNMFDAIIKMGKRDGYRLVPQYNMDARGGFGANDEIDTKEYVVDYIPFKDAKESDICIPVSGNSMSPVYAPGTIILLHKVETWKEFIEFGQVYVIILTDGRRLLKELKRGAEKDKFLCVSYNPSFDPAELSKDLISDVYLVTAIYQKTTI